MHLKKWTGQNFLNVQIGSTGRLEFCRLGMFCLAGQLTGIAALASNSSFASMFSISILYLFSVTLYNPCNVSLVTYHIFSSNALFKKKHFYFKNVVSILNKDKTL